jgi:hypothetical protein
MIGTWVNHDSCWLIPEDPVTVLIDDEFLEICDIHLRLGGLSAKLCTKYLMGCTFNLFDVSYFNHISAFDPIVLLRFTSIDRDQTSSDPRKNITESDFTVFFK